MRALLYHDGQIRLTEVPTPTPAKGEALIRLLVAGVCETDLEILKGYMDFRGILGHEFVGIVEQAENEHLRGRRVVGEINCVCGQCRYCQLEMPHHCLSRTVLGIQGRDGAFAEYLVLPEANLHPVSNAIRDDVAVFTEPVASAFRILEQVTVTEQERVIVLGDGKLGQLIAQVLWLNTKRLLCVGKHRWKLELLRRLNIPTAHVDDPIEPHADMVVDATGSLDGLEFALRLVRPEGTIVLKTTVAQAAQLHLATPAINEVRIIGSRCGPFRPALEALTLGTVEVRHLISEMYTLDDGEKALKRASDPDVVKVLICMGR